MKHIDPKKISTQEIFALLTGGINPRPIALVATKSENGSNNLAPFSFFNAFGANPPMIAFSPSSRVRDGSKKDTYYNLKRTGECTVQVVSYDMVEQTNLASTEYETGIDEFTKSGLTPIKSDLVASPRVKESPFQMECKLDQIIHLGRGKGSGNLMLCEVIRFHIDEVVFADKNLNPYTMDLVGRNGSDFYTRANGNALFRIKKPLQSKGIGYDQLPEFMKLSAIFTGNDLASFGNSETVPAKSEVEAFRRASLSKYKVDPQTDLQNCFRRAKREKDYQHMLNLALLSKLKKHPHYIQMIEQAAQVALQAKETDFAWKAALLAGE